MTMGSHQSALMKSDTWLTPKYIIDELGPFDLDPCCPENMPWKTAHNNYTPKENGLLSEWEGRIWLNPPYSREAVKWLEKLANHGCGTALIFARTETKWFLENVWNKATAVLFIHGRITFCDINGIPAKANSGAPSVLVAYGKHDSLILKHCDIKGSFFYNYTPFIINR